MVRPMNSGKIGACIGEWTGMEERVWWGEAEERALAYAIKVLGLESGDVLLKLAQGDEGLKRELVGFFCNQETYFWRHQDQFWVLIENLKKLCKRRAMLVWSAGCGSGEEPYSLAMAVRERLPAHAVPHIHILATDVSAKAIERAKVGCYGDGAFEGAPQALRERYFCAGQAGGWQLEEPILDAVDFACETILETCARLADGSVDAILFRNVAEDLTPEAREQIYVQFHRVLVPDGIVLIAPTDPPPGIGSGFACVAVRHSLYLRTEGVVRSGKRASPTTFAVRVSGNSVQNLVKMSR